MNLAESIARVIEPGAWDNYDRALAPYQRGTGSIGDENWLYEETWAHGCRTPDDVSYYLLESERDFTRATHTLTYVLRDSLDKANHIIDIMNNHVV